MLAFSWGWAFVVVILLLAPEVERAILAIFLKRFFFFALKFYHTRTQCMHQWQLFILKCIINAAFILSELAQAA